NRTKKHGRKPPRAPAGDSGFCARLAWFRRRRNPTTPVRLRKGTKSCRQRSNFARLIWHCWRHDLLLKKQEVKPLLNRLSPVIAESCREVSLFSSAQPQRSLRLCGELASSARTITVFHFHDDLVFSTTTLTYSKAPNLIICYFSFQKEDLCASLLFVWCLVLC